MENHRKAGHPARRPPCARSAPREYGLDPSADRFQTRIRPNPERRLPMTRSTRTRRHTFRPRLDALEERQLLSAGALDTATFNPPDGFVLTPFSWKNNYSTAGEAHAVQIQSDGKIVAAG